MAGHDMLAEAYAEGSRRPQFHHAQAILGRGLHARLASVKVLLIGVGGIGCELLKNLVLTGFRDITLVDRGSVEVSDLNHGFLYRRKNAKQSKAMVAALAAKEYNPSVHLSPVRANIMEPEFDASWFRSFDIVLNAVKTLDVRLHVNRMCIAAAVPLVDSEAAGYIGHVQPVLKDLTECLECKFRTATNASSISSIQSTPDQPSHCVEWAKNYLFPELFGKVEGDGAEVGYAVQYGENALKFDLQDKKQLSPTPKDLVRSFPITTKQATTSDLRNVREEAIRSIFQKVFNEDVKGLLTQADTWSTRTSPMPLDFDEIRNDTFRPMPLFDSMSHNSSIGSLSRRQLHETPESQPYSDEKASDSRDQGHPTLQDSLELFTMSTNRLVSRVQTGEVTIIFDEDDGDILDFITASANLRAATYGIASISRWEVENIARNRVPAAVTTYAVVAGVAILQTLQLLRRNYTGLRHIQWQLRPEVLLEGSPVGPPLKECTTCRDMYFEMLCDPTRVTLGQALAAILGNFTRDVSVYESKRLLLNSNLYSNLEKSLESLGVTRRKFLTIVDEEWEWTNLSVSIGVLPPLHPKDGIPLILPSPLPNLLQSYKPKAEDRPIATAPTRHSAIEQLPSTDSGSSSEDDVPRNKRDRTVALLRDHKNLAEPRTSQGVFGPNGQLVCFFRWLPRIVRAEHEEHPHLPSLASRGAETIPRLFQSPTTVVDAVRRLAMAATDRPFNSFGTKGPDDAHSILRIMNNLLSTSQAKLLQGTERSRIGESVPGNYSLLSKRLSTIYIKNKSAVTRVHRALAVDYILHNSDPAQFCAANSVVASRHARYDHERVFRLLKSILSKPASHHSNTDNEKRSFRHLTPIASTAVKGLYHDLLSSADLQLLAMFAVPVLAAHRAIEHSQRRTTRTQSSSPSAHTPVRTSGLDYFTLRRRKDSQPTSKSTPPHLTPSPGSHMQVLTLSSSSSSKGSWSSLFHAGSVRQLVGGGQDPSREGSSDPQVHAKSSLSVKSIGVPGERRPLLGPELISRTRSNHERAVPLSLSGANSWPEPPVPSPIRLNATFSSAGHGARRSAFSQLINTPTSIPEKPMLVVKSDRPEEHCDCLICEPRIMEQLLGHVVAYADMLYSWELFSQRAELLKSLHVELRVTPLQVNVMEESKINVERLYSDCSNVIEAADISRHGSASQTRLPLCSVCRVPVKGLSRPCLLCGHVTHMKCWQNQQFKHCPTGCGCHCREDLSSSIILGPDSIA